MVYSDAAQLEDVAPSALMALGVQPAGMEGHVLTEALNQPKKPYLETRAREVRQVAPLVDAMVAQDNLESSQ